MNGNNGSGMGGLGDLYVTRGELADVKEDLTKTESCVKEIQKSVSNIEISVAVINTKMEDLVNFKAQMMSLLWKCAGIMTGVTIGGSTIGSLIYSAFTATTTKQPPTVAP